MHPAQAAQSGTDSEETIPFIQFPNSPVEGVLDFYEKLTGKRIIRDATVQGNVDIVVKKAVTKSEAIQIVETALMVNGFSLMAGPDNMVIVLLSKNPRSFGVPIYFDLDDLPQDNTVVTFIFRPQYVDPTEVFAVISSYVPPANGVAPLVLGAPGKAQSIAVTESTTVIRSLAEIIRQMDKPPAEVVPEFITLKRADAKDVLDKLKEIFEKPATGGAAAQPTQPVQPNQPGQPPQNQLVIGGETAGATTTPLTEDSLIVGKIKLTADVRTNRIYVVTRPINMPFVRKLIEEFDSDLAFAEPTVRPLLHVSAGDVLDVIVKAIAQPGGKEGEGGSEAAKAAPVSNPTNYSGGTGLSTTGGIGGTGGTSGAGSNLGAEELTTKEVETVPEARTVGSTKIIADKRANTIIIMGNEEMTNKVRRVLDKLDVPAPQVLLTVVVGELTLDDSKSFGAQYLAHPKPGAAITTSTTITVTGTNGTTSTATIPVVTGTGLPSGIFAGVANSVLPSGSSVPDLSSLSSAAAVAAAFGSSGGITGLIAAGQHLDVLINALESQGRFKVISRPMVYAQNNKKAIIASGQQVPVPSQTQSGFGYASGTTSGNNGLVSTSNVTYQDVSLKLEVQPLINSNNEVTLDIVQEVNSLANTTGVTTTSGITAPTINSRRIKTTVSVANEATIVLGGLVQENKSVSKSGIPILDKIPLLGPLFSSKSTQTTRTELIVMIRPSVTNTPAAAVKAGERAQEGMDFPPDLEHTLDPAGTRVKADRKSNGLLVSPKADPL